MSVKAFIVGKETAWGTLFKRLLNTYAIEAVFVEKTEALATAASRPPAALWVFLESTHAMEWMELPRRLPPSWLLPECFPPPIPFEKLAKAPMRLMPRQTDFHLLAKWLLLDVELRRFPQSIVDLSEENQQEMLSIFEEFRQALGEAHSQIHASLMQACLNPDSPQPLAELRTLVHRLAGSGGSYGFVALSKAAKAIETAIDNKEKRNIQNLTHAFLEMLSLLLLPKPPAPSLSKTLFVLAPSQQARSQHVHWFQKLNVHALWGMDWVDCWTMPQTHPLGGALLNMDNLPLEAWPLLFEVLNSLPAFAALPKHLVKQNASEAEKACAARLGCLGPSAPPATFEAFSEMVQAFF